MKLGSTGLTVRELKVTKRPWIELSPKQVAAWIEQLPAANLGESSQSIYRILVDANQSIIESEIRLNILNIIEPVALNLVDSLERQFINNHLSLSEKQRKIAALVQALQTELSFGYHAVIESLSSEGVKRSTKKSLAQAICYAIKYHGLVILRCYQLYASVPSRVWRELYSLYKMAKQHQVENLKFSLAGSGQSWSAKDSFIQILLLSISNPYQLRQREIELVWKLLPEYVEFCSLEAHSYSKNPFLLNLNSNAPPVQKSLYVNDDAENKLKISVVAVVDKIKVDLAQVNEKAKYSARKTMVFKHLIHCWSQGTQRSFARTSCGDEIYVTIGLGATHFLLTESLINNHIVQTDSDAETEFSKQTLEAMEGSLKDATIATVSEDRRNLKVAIDRNYLSTSAITNNDVWAKLYRPDQALANAESGHKIEQRSRETIVRDSYKIQKSSIINMSPGGYCIQVSTVDLPKHTQTGEIIGFIEGSQNSHQWSLGIVRWVRRQIKGNFVQMGVQLLAPHVLPISVQLKNNKNEASSPQRALLLPALTDIGPAATIITNPLAFDTNNKLKVREPNKEYDVRLCKEISSSGSSKQFSFEKIAPSKERKRADKPKKASGPNDVDGIWDLI